MRELPDEENREERDGWRFDDAARGGPADEWRSRAREGTDEGVQPGNALQWVDADVTDGGEQRERAGEEIRRPHEVQRTEEGEEEACDESAGEADAMRAIGRCAVRGMRRSVTRSNAWLSALEPPVTSVMPKSA